MNFHIIWLGQTAHKTNAKTMANIAGEATTRPIGRPIKRKTRIRRGALGNKNTRQTKKYSQRGLKANINGRKTKAPVKQRGVQSELEEKNHDRMHVTITYIPADKGYYT